MTTYTWNVNADGEWTTSDNWSPSGPPPDGSDATIDTATLHTISIANGESVTVANLTVGNDNISISNSTLTITASASFSNSLTLNGSSYLFLGGVSASTGVLWFSGGDLDGTGTFTVVGSTFISGSDPVVESGSGTTLLKGTSSISGTLNLDGGRILENKGTVGWSGGNLNLGSNPLGTTVGGGEIKNDSGGSFYIRTDGQIADPSSLGGTSLVNAGYLNKVNSTGTTDIKVAFTNTGAVEVQSGTLAIDDGGSSTGGSITADASATLDFNGGTFSLNGGTISGGGLIEVTAGKLSGIGSTTVSVAFSNTATVSAGTGTLNFAGGGTSSAGTIGAASGATLEFSSHAFTVSGGSYNVLGTTDVESTTLDLSAVTLTSLGAALDDSGSLLLGVASATVGSLDEAGAIDGTGKLTVTGSATFSETAANTGNGTTLLKGTTTISALVMTLDSRVFENQGTLAWTSGDIDLNGTAAAIKNDSGATFDIQTDNQINQLGTGASFVNAGTLKKSAGTGTSEIAPAFTNSGAVSVQSGTLDILGAFSNTGTVSILTGATLMLGGGGTSSANAFSLSSGSTLDFDYGVFTLTGTAIGGAGVTQIAHAVLDVDATVTNLGAKLLMSATSAKLELNSAATVASLEQQAGLIDGTGTLTVTGAATIDSGVQTGSGTTRLKGTTSAAGFALDGGRVVENQGTLNWSGFNLYLGYGEYAASVGGATIKNDSGATFDIQAATRIYSDLGTNAFVNAGLLEQTVTTGTTHFQATFTNTGTIAVSTGTFEFDATSDGGTIGVDAFSGTIKGAGSVVIDDSSTFSALTISETVQVTNNATITQTGAVTLGDATGGAKFSNVFDATYAIAGDFNIAGGAGAGTFFTNDGTLTKTAGAGVSVISVNVTDTDTIDVNSGTLDFTGAVDTFSGAIDGAGTIQFGGGSSTFQDFTTLSVAKLRESGATTTLSIGALSYAGALTLSSGTLTLRETLTLTGNNALTGAITGAGQLTVAGGATTINAGSALSMAELAESGAATKLYMGTLSYAGTLTQTAGTLTLPGTLTLTGVDSLVGAINGAGTLAIAGGSTTIQDSSTLAVANVLESGAATKLSIGTLLYAGGLTVNSGTLTLPGTLTLKGTNTLAGAITGAGTMAVTGGSTTINNGTALSVANLGLSGASTKLSIGTLSYAGTLTQNSGTLTLPGTLTLTGANVLTGAITGAGQLSVTSGSTTINTGSALSVARLTESGASTTLSIGTLSYANTLTMSSGTLTLLGTMTLTGTNNTITGAIGGAGKLAITGGNTKFNAGATLSMAAWSIAGAANVTLAEAVTYAGAFAMSGGTLALGAGNLTLTGADTITGGTVVGAHLLVTSGSAKSVSGFTVGTSTKWQNTSTVNESGASATIGASSGTSALDNTSTGIYDLLGDVGLLKGTSATSTITNEGLLEKTGGVGVSTIVPAMTNTGTIKVTKGTLDLQGAVTGTGADVIVGASVLEFDSSVASGQSLYFNGNGGTLDLGAPQSFAGAIKGFDIGTTGDAIDILSGWTFTGATEGASSTKLAFVDGSSHLTLTLAGAYTGTFSATAITGGTKITYAA